MIRPTTLAARALVLTLVFGICSPAALGAPAIRPVVRGRVVAPPATRPAIAPELAPIPLGWSLPFVLLLACIALMPFIAPKGSVALDGVSLTVNEVEADRFGVNIIPHTLSHTGFGEARPGTRMNIEIDPLARYVARLLQARSDSREQTP